VDPVETPREIVVNRRDVMRRAAALTALAGHLLGGL
jgi:hypothetical protein